MEIPLRIQLSPVPAHTMLWSDGLIASAPIDCDFCLSNTGFHTTPPSVDFHAARSSARKIDVLVARRADHRRHAIARRSGVAELQAAQVNAIDDGRPIGHLDLQLLWLWRAATLRCELRDDGGQQYQHAEKDAKRSVHMRFICSRSDV